MTSIKVPIQDRVFLCTGAKSMGGLFCEPSYIEWIPVASGMPARFYTETDIADAPNHSHPRVGWLINPPPIEQANYDVALKYEAELDYILTHVKSYIERDPSKWLYYPMGGSHIPLSQWHDYPKTDLVSMLASDKNVATGHKLRYEVKARFGDQIDIWGRINDGTEVSKLDAIAPYCYGIEIDCESHDWYFSDHLLDYFALGTVPIFWGCPEIYRFFDINGIIPFDKADDLSAILDRLSKMDFVNRLPAIYRNREIARQYRVPEDWIFTHYPFLFDGLPC